MKSGVIARSMFGVRFEVLWADDNLLNKEAAEKSHDSSHDHVWHHRAGHVDDIPHQGGENDLWQEVGGVKCRHVRCCAAIGGRFAGRRIRLWKKCL